MKDIDYKEAGINLVNEAKTDSTTALQLLAAGYEIVLRMSRNHPDKETAADVQDIVAILGDDESLPKPKWAGTTQAKALAKGLVAVSRHRMTRSIDVSVHADVVARIKAEEVFDRCDQRRLQSSRIMSCLDLLENVIEIDRVLALRDPREAALIFWHKIFLDAPKYLMELEEQTVDYENEGLRDKYRGEIWEIIRSHVTSLGRS